MYDLLVVGGHVFDPGGGIEGHLDVAISGGTIAEIGQDIARDEARQIVDVTGKLVTPGLIDLHVHVLDGVNGNSVDPDVAGVESGVTTVVDAGSAGPATFRAFPRHVMPRARTEIIPFLNLGQTGLATRPDIYARDSVNLKDVLRTFEAYPNLIRGLKVRMVNPALEIFGLDLARMGRQVAQETGTRLMVHIGDPTNTSDPGVIRDLLPMLEAGDIVTHLFTPNRGGVLDEQGMVISEVYAAVERGVILDSAHGVMNFSIDMARRVLDQGLLPHCISTDMSAAGRRLLGFSMTDIMTRFLAFGLSLADVVKMATSNPAKAIGAEDNIGSLAVGRAADVSVLEVRTGEWGLRDATGNSMAVGTLITPVLAVKGGSVHVAGLGPHDGSWEPTEGVRST